MVYRNKILAFRGSSLKRSKASPLFIIHFSLQVFMITQILPANGSGKRWRLREAYITCLGLESAENNCGSFCCCVGLRCESEERLFSVPKREG
jgi:hypothetical protein